MSSNNSVQVFYSGGITLTISNKSLREATNIFMFGEPFKGYVPEKVFIKSEKITLLFDRAVFRLFLNNEISETEMYTRLDITLYYRNSVDYLTEENQVIDAGSLWKREGDNLFLVDDDNLVECVYNSKLFDRL